MLLFLKLANITYNVIRAQHPINWFYWFIKTSLLHLKLKTSNKQQAFNSVQSVLRNSVTQSYARANRVHSSPYSIEAELAVRKNTAMIKYKFEY